MVRAITVQVRRKGTLTLPSALRRKYQVGDGDVFTLLDLGDGCLLLTPQVSQLARLGDQVAELMAAEGVTTEDMLRALDEERAAYYRDHYVRA